MALDEVFKKYDYIHATEETKDELTEILVDKRSDFEDAGTLKNLQKSLSVLKEKNMCERIPRNRFTWL